MESLTYQNYLSMVAKVVFNANSMHISKISACLIAVNKKKFLKACVRVVWILRGVMPVFKQILKAEWGVWNVKTICHTC
jgi:hypothetical protein